MGVSVCLLTYLGVALGGDPIDPKPEILNHFFEVGGFPCWNPGQTGEGSVMATALVSLPDLPVDPNIWIGNPGQRLICKNG